MQCWKADQLCVIAKPHASIVAVVQVPVRVGFPSDCSFLELSFIRRGGFDPMHLTDDPERSQFLRYFSLIHARHAHRVRGTPLPRGMLWGHPWGFMLLSIVRPTSMVTIL